jgi:hypothetical protein
MYIFGVSLNESVIHSELEKSKPTTRLVSFDILRGLALIFMVSFHVFMKTYDYTWIMNEPEIIADMPIILIIFAVIIGYLSMWISFFILLSGTVNSYVMSKKVLNGSKPSSLLRKQILNGVLILIFGRLQENVIGYFGYLGYSLKTGIWTNFMTLYTSFWTIRALDVIGWCIILNAIIHYLLMLKGGFRLYLRNVIIYLVLGAGILAVTPIIKAWALSIQPTEHNFLSWFLNTLVLDFDVIFPYLFSSFLGSMLGITLARPKNPKKIVIRGGLSIMFLLSLISFLLIYFKVANNLPATIFSKPPEIPTYLILTVGQIGVLILTLSLIEFRGKGEKLAHNPFVRNLRLWSMISLSIFLFDVFELLPRAILTLVLGNFIGLDFMSGSIFTGQIGLLWASLLGLFVLSFFQLFVWLWSKIEFKFGAEWIMIRIQTLVTKQKSKKLDFENMMNEVEWVSFID